MGVHENAVGLVAGCARIDIDEIALEEVKLGDGPTRVEQGVRAIASIETQWLENNKRARIQIPNEL